MGWIGIGAVTAAAAQDEDETRITGFSIPNTRSAKALSERAASHVEAKRYNEAIEDLQELIESHRAELVPVPGRRSSGQAVHRGAAGWAAEILGKLPRKARELYRARFAKRARAALDLARSKGDRQAIINLAERWPATEQAITAWWVLGDLELEIGNLSQARESWMRALTQHLIDRVGWSRYTYDGELEGDWTAALAEIETAGFELRAGERQRCDFAIASLAETHPLAEASRLRQVPQGSLRLPGPDEGAQGTPGPDASTWPRPFKIPVPHPFEPGNSGNLFPVRVGDLVFLSNSLSLFAVNAYSGNLRWASEQPPGWDGLSSRDRDEFFEGIAPRDTMIAPAASERVVVSAHQVPVTDLENATFRNIAITTIIPDRRLYAYDVQSGEELWNHHPPETWDGESGSFTDRVSVAGPPVINASRVIVPVHRMYGRIEFYVACYDLVTGEPLWTTQLVSGQRELNMFARAEREFSAPPVRIEGDRVVVLTQLGAVAVLDLFSGSILWESLYDQIVPPTRSSFSAQRIKNYWRNAAPVVADGVIVVTPFDSRNLIGFDLASGETLWTVPHAYIDQLAGPYRDDVNLLIGADRNTVYLGGWPVMALRSSGGLRREEPIELAWRYPAGEIENDNSTSARAVLLSDRIIIPTRNERIEVDRFGGGRRHKSVPWKSGRSGNLLVQDGTLYTLTSGHLDGYFEWDMLLERGRRAYEEAEGDRDSSLYLASLLSERSRTEREAGRTALARNWLVEAEALLEPFLVSDDIDAAITAEMHSLLRTRGRVFIDLADGASAMKALRRAREFAPDLAALRDTLVEEYSFVYGNDAKASSEVLEALASRCRPLTLSAVVTLEDGLPYQWRFEPVIAAPEDSFAIWRLPVSMWVTLERSNSAAKNKDVIGELEQLHAMLDDWPDQPIPSPESSEELLSEFASRRIGELIEEHGRGPHARFENEARELLDEARSTKDRTLLSMVNDHYPWSEAAREANDQLLEWAAEAGDVEAVAEIALREIPAFWGPEVGGEREVQLMLHLGAALENAGNREYSGALYRALAEEQPQVVSSSPSHNSQTLAQLGQVEAIEELEMSPSAFAPDFEPIHRAGGRHSFLGVIPPSVDETEITEPVLLYARDEGQHSRVISFVAYTTTRMNQGRAEPLWSVRILEKDLPPTWRHSVAFAPGTVIAGTPDSVYALNRNDGSYAWSSEWMAPDGKVNSLQAKLGLVIVSVRTPEKMDAIHALDWTNGRQVWQAELDSLRQDYDLVLGHQRVVLMPRRSQRRGLILDHFSGRQVGEFELPTRMVHSAHDAAWIEQGLLLVPWFLNGRYEERNHLVAVDLWSGEIAWQVNFNEIAGGRRELRSIVEYDGVNYLLLRPTSDAHKDGVRGIFVKLHVVPRMGATARVGSFEQEDEQRLMGIHQERRVSLDSPFVYFFSFTAGEGAMSVQCLNLPYGQIRWNQELDLNRDELHNSLMQLPAESESHVAMVISKKGEKRLITESTSMYVLNKGTGRQEMRMQLDTQLGASPDVRLLGLGKSLILAGKNRLEVVR